MGGDLFLSCSLSFNSSRSFVMLVSCFASSSLLCFLSKWQGVYLWRNIGTHMSCQRCNNSSVQKVSVWMTETFKWNFCLLHIHEANLDSCNLLLIDNHPLHNSVNLFVILSSYSCCSFTFPQGDHGMLIFDMHNSSSLELSRLWTCR